MWYMCVPWMLGSFFLVFHSYPTGDEHVICLVLKFRRIDFFLFSFWMSALCMILQFQGCQVIIIQTALGHWNWTDWKCRWIFYWKKKSEVHLHSKWCGKVKYSLGFSCWSSYFRNGCGFFKIALKGILNSSGWSFAVVSYMTGKTTCLQVNAPFPWFMRWFVHC